MVYDEVGGIRFDPTNQLAILLFCEIDEIFCLSFWPINITIKNTFKDLRMFFLFI